jgi:hypothetical protein
MTDTIGTALAMIALAMTALEMTALAMTALEMTALAITALAMSALAMPDAGTCCGPLSVTFSLIAILEMTTLLM